MKIVKKVAFAAGIAAMAAALQFVCIGTVHLCHVQLLPSGAHLE